MKLKSFSILLVLLIAVEILSCGVKKPPLPPLDEGIQKKAADKREEQEKKNQ